MTPMPDNDPRHGTPSGSKAHARAGTTPCEACRKAKTRSDKRLRVYGGTRVQLPEEAWRIARDNDLRLLIRATGVSECALLNIRRRGGDLRVYPKTVTRILGFDPITDEGIVRRVRALGAIGWSARAISAATDGRLHHESILTLQRCGADDRMYIRDHVRAAIVAVYEDLHMKVPTPTRSTAATITRARRLRWEPPLAWDHIDDVTEIPYAGVDPAVRPHDEVDEARVLRILAGSRIDTTRAEKEECIRRWIAAGKAPQTLTSQMNWHDSRYLPARDQEAS